MPISAVTGLDHFVVRAPDLDRAEAAFSRLGFRLTPRGFHAGKGSANHTAPFENGTYFELLYIPPEAVDGPGAGLREGFERPVAIAVRTKDSRKVHAELEAHGFVVQAPRDLSRPVKLPGGTFTARFLNVSFPPVEPPAVSMFACQQMTRELVWRAEWQAHPNGAQGVAGLIVVHAKPTALRDVYATLFAETSLATDEELRVRLGTTTLRFLSPGRFAATFPGVDLDVRAGDGWFAGAVITVKSLDPVRALLNQGKIPSTTAPEGALVVRPADAGGTLIAFHQV